MLTWLIDQLEKHHNKITIGGLLAALVSAVLLIQPGLYEEYSIASFVGGDNPEFDRFQQFVQTFGGSELAVVAVKGESALSTQSLSCIQQLSSASEQLPGVQRVSSVSKIPKVLRERIIDHPLVSGLLVSKDRRTAAVVLQMRDDTDQPALRRESVTRLRHIVQQARGDYPEPQIMLTGPYVTMYEMFEYVRQDLALFSIFVVILMFGALFALIGQWRYCVFIIALGAASTLCALGVTTALALNMSLSMQMVVIMVSVLAVANGVHLAVAHREQRQASTAAPHQARSTLQRMLLPCSAVMLTSAAGFSSVTVSELKPIVLFGAVMVFGLLLALVLALSSVFWLPAEVGRTRDSRAHFHGWLADMLQRAVAASIRYDKGVIVAFAALAIALLIPIPQLRFESNFVHNFRPGSSVRRGYEFVEHNLAPMNSFELIVSRKDRGEVVTPQALRATRSMSRAAVSAHQAIQKVLSIADLLQLLSPQLPDTPQEIALRLTITEQLLAPALGENAFRHFLTADHTKMRISVRVREAPSVWDKIDLAHTVQQQARAAFGDEYDVQLTGLYYFYATLIAGLLREQNFAFGISLAAVFLMTALFLKSWRLAALAMVPNLFPMLACLGLMGYLGIPINMATSMMLSIALGIAIDDTIHYIWRFRHERQHGALPAEALIRTHRSVGQACVFTTVVIAGGFWILCFSRFLPTAYFGALVGLTMLTALAADLILLPVLLLMCRSSRTL